MTIKLIVGLRNPGIEYAQTRHNVGNWFINAVQDIYSMHFKINKSMHAELTQVNIANHMCRFLLSLDFMNNNGYAVSAISNFLRIEPAEILIVHDDLDLDCGRIKLKTTGSSGGHHGVQNVISQLGTKHFNRLRIGIGHPGHKDLVSNYVLNKPILNEKQLIINAIHYGVSFVPMLVQGNIEAVMNTVNGKI